MAKQLNTVEGISVNLGAWTLEDYFYPLLRLKYPRLFDVQFFPRQHKDVTVLDYAHWTFFRILNQTGPRIWIGHSAGAVALWIALVMLAKAGRLDLVPAVILMHPANIGPGSTRIDITDKHKLLSRMQYFTKHMTSAFYDPHRKHRQEVEVAYAAAGLSEPHFTYHDEQWPFVSSALNGLAQTMMDELEPAVLKSLQDRSVIIKGGIDDVITPVMTDETAKNIGVRAVLYPSLNHHTPQIDKYGRVLKSGLGHVGYKISKHGRIVAA